MPFPTLDGFGPTRRTLQLYSRALSGLARVHGVAHPNWWHISLRVTPSGLQGDNIPLPGGGILAGRLDLLARQLVLWTSGGGEWALPLDGGLSGTAMGERLIAAAAITRSPIAVPLSPASSGSVQWPPPLVHSTSWRDNRSSRPARMPPPGRGMLSLSRPLGVTRRLMCHQLGWATPWTRARPLRARPYSCSVRRVGPKPSRVGKGMQLSPFA